jgi:lactoylglutathione lyase
MKLNHLTLAVRDVPHAGTFLEKHFGLRSMGGNEKMAGWWDDDGLVLVLVRIAYPPGFHVGFTQSSAAKVDEIHRGLAEHGIEAPSPGRVHGAWGFYFEAPGGFTVEVTAPQ